MATELTVKQSIALNFLEDDFTNEILFGGAAGGAKSFLGCYWVLKTALKYPDCRMLIGRSKLKNLRATTLKTFFEVCKKQGLKNLVHYKYNTTNSVITLQNGSEIILMDLFSYPSDLNFDKLGSLEITGAFVDEANQITSKARNILTSRIRFKLKEYNLVPKILFTCNPARNWVYSEFYKPSKDNALPPHRIFVRALISDNPHISKHYIENLNKLPPIDRERLRDGNWDYDQDPTRLVDYANIYDIYTNTFVKSGKKYLSCDIALQGSDRFVLCVWNGWICEKIFSIPKSDGQEVEDQIKSVAEAFSIPQSHIVYDADGVGGYLKGYLKNAVSFHNGASPLKEGEGDDEDRVKVNYANLKTQCYFHLAQKIRDNGLYIKDCNPEHAELINEELAHIKRDRVDTDGKLYLVRKEKVKEDLGRSPDFADAIMMRCYFDIENVYTSDVVGCSSGDDLGSSVDNDFFSGTN